MGLERTVRDGCDRDKGLGMGSSVGLQRNRKASSLWMDSNQGSDVIIFAF